MAKKDKDAIYQDFLADLKSAVGDDKWSEIEEGLIKNEKASAKLRDGVLARSEFSSQMDALREAQESFATYQAQEKQKIEGWQKWYGDTSKEQADLQSTVAAYREAYGDLEGGAERKRYLTPEEFEKTLNQRLNESLQAHSSAAVKFSTDLNDIMLEHRDRFKERLDINGVFDIVSKKNIPLELAYKEFIADKVEAVQKAEFADAIKRAKEEGAAEALSKHNLPTVPNNSTIIHTLDAQTSTPTNARDRIAAAVASFNQLTSKR
jgi:hypothetical protein